MNEILCYMYTKKLAGHMLQISCYCLFCVAKKMRNSVKTLIIFNKLINFLFIFFFNKLVYYIRFIKYIVNIVNKIFNYCRFLCIEKFCTCIICLICRLYNEK